MEQEFHNSDYKLLETINSPEDLNKIKDLSLLCDEIRHKLIETISQNGGHLSSNLGVVELTVMLHKIFNTPEDKIVWDVGHQSYVHKMLTGRFNKLDTIRTQGGLSGFTNRFESPYDSFTSGHSSTSVSAALGLAQSKKIFDEKGHVVAVIGDGALTGGLAYEGLNNAGRFKKNFIIILNDNNMSISRNVGAVARCLSAARIRPSYMKAKNLLDRILDKTKLGINLKYFMKQSKSVLKRMVYKSSVFEDMGFAYYGPVDGHNLSQLQKVLSIAKSFNKPVVVHVITTKGKGYKFAEKKPGIYHGVSSFDALTGVKAAGLKKTFSDEFGKAMCENAENDERICAITAAMTSGTGLSEFSKKYKSRFFDVGIAEAHAVTFAGGLASGGLIPVFAVYSSFFQRAYDEIIHDAALQRFKMVFAVDRAGLIGEDGETHQGVFDVPFLNTVPNVCIFAPAFVCELAPMLGRAIYESQNIGVIRYPRGAEFTKPDDFKYTGNDFDYYGDKNADALIVTYGRIFSNAYFAAQELVKTGINCGVLKINVIKPLDSQAARFASKFKNVIFFEESIQSGGVAEKFAFALLKCGFKGRFALKAVPDRFVPHMRVESQLEMFSFDVSGIKNTTENFVKNI